MILYSSPLCRVGKRLRLIQRIIKATATLLLFAFVPLTKDIAVADVANNRSPAAAAREPRTLVQGRAILTSGTKAQIAPPQAEVVQGQKATFTSHSVADPDVPIISLQWSGPGGQNSGGDRFVVDTAMLRPATYEVRLTVTDKHERKSQTVATLIVRQGTSDRRNTDRGTSDGPGGVEYRSPVAKINPDRESVKQGDAAHFVSNSRHPDPRGKIVRYTWTTQWGQTGERQALDIDTKQLRPGAYWVRLEVADQRRFSSSDTARLLVSQNNPNSGNDKGTSDGVESRPPMARINPREKLVTQGEIASFASASRHPDPRGRIIRQAWATQWGQKALGETLDVDTRQLRPGRYRLILDVTDQRELHATDTATLVVTNRPNPPPHPGTSDPRPDPLPPPVLIQPHRPIATITPKLREVDQGEGVFFDGRQSRDPDGTIVAWSWRIDGSPLSSGQFVDLNAVSLSPGSHNVSLEVTDNQGLTAMDSATVVVKPPKKIDLAVLKLEVAPPEPAPNREVQITAVVANEGTDSAPSVKVRFEVAGTLLKEMLVPSLSPGEKKQVNAQWTARSSGEYIVAVRVDPDNRLPDSNRTNNTTTRAVAVRTPVVVTITPNSLEVNRGANAQFVSHAAFSDGRSVQGLKYMWHGPADRIGQGSSFQLDTADIKPGKHQINLEVSQGQGATTKATATLVVVEPPPQVWLTADTENPDVGQTIKFTGGTKPSLGDTEYKFFFGDATETNWSTIPEATHKYQEPRNYTARIVARRAGVTLGQTSAAVTVKEVPYSVTLTSDQENVRQGHAVTFTARVKPPLDDVEYQFRFSDAPAKEWTRAATTTRLFSRDGTYAATVAIRIRGTRVVESQAVHISVSAPEPSLWLWVAVLAVAVIAAAATAYIKRKLLRVKFSVVPNADLASLTIATSAKIDSDCSIGVRAARGDYKCMIQVDGALVRS